MYLLLYVGLFAYGLGFMCTCLLNLLLALRTVVLGCYYGLVIVEVFWACVWSCGVLTGLLFGIVVLGWCWWWFCFVCGGVWVLGCFVCCWVWFWGLFVVGYLLWFG